MMNYDFTVQSANPMQGINNALQTYGNMRNIQLQEEQAGLQRQEYAQKQEAAAAQKARAQRYQSRLAEISEDPSPRNILGLSVEFPEASEAHERVFKMADEERQRAATQTANNIFTAYNSGKPEIAQGLIQKHLEAAKNSGDKGNIDFYTMFSEIAEENPKQAQAIAGQMLTATKEGRESLKALDDSANTKSQIDFREFDKNIKRSEMAFKVEQAKFNQAKDERERELHAAKMDEHKRKLEELERTKSSEVSNSASSIDNMINTVDKALSFKSGVFDDVLGTVDSRVFTFGEEEADLEETIELLTNQAFMAQIPNITGLGALSDAEGKKLANSLQSLSLRQSPKSMKASLREIQRLLSKSRENLFKKHGIEQTIPDTPYALKTLDDVTLTPESSVDIGALLDKELGLSQ